MNSSMFISSSRVHLVVTPDGDSLRPCELFFRLFDLWDTWEYYFLMLSRRSFFSFAIRWSSSLLKTMGPDEVGASFGFEELRDDAFDITDFESSGANFEGRVST